MQKEIDLKLALSFKALSHPRRARIFRLLANDALVGQSFGHLMAATGIKSGPLIHHVREMERCGLIVRQCKGQTVTYALTTPVITLACDTVQALSHRSGQNFRDVA